MKKNLLILFAAMFVSIITFAQTAPDFTATDCNGNSHNLYSELNAGKVIVLDWVMPCGACVGPSLTAYNIVQSYASSNVLYYLIDDDGGTSCTSLSSWATGSNIGTNRQTFSTTSIIENSYGGMGMPHVVVVGSVNHTIYFNGLNAAAGDAAGIQSAINTAIAATGIPVTNSNTFEVSVSPSPSSQFAKVTYSITEASNVTLTVFSGTGQLVSKKEMGNQAAGKYNVDFDLGKTANGIYFMRLTSGKNSQTAKFNVSN